MSRKLLGELPIAASGEIDELPEVLMRTLIGDDLSSDKIYAPRKEALAQMFRYVQKIIYCVCELGDVGDWSMSREEIDLTFRGLDSINVVCVYRQIFTTCNGRLGMGPRCMEPGDIICVFQRRADTAHITARASRC
jgi:hypothetical protein